MNISTALNILLKVALFGASIYWALAAKKILVNKDYSFVALKGGEPPPNPAKWAPYSAIINVLGAAAGFGTIIYIFAFDPSVDEWSKAGGLTIWCKIIADFCLSRTAHPMKIKKKDK